MTGAQSNPAEASNAAINHHEKLLSELNGKIKLLGNLLAKFATAKEVSNRTLNKIQKTRDLMAKADEIIATHKATTGSSESTEQ